MIKNYLLYFLLAVMFISCDTKTKKEPVTNMDVANTFVRHLLDNKFTEAEQYLLKDDTNNQIFERFKNQYNKKDKATLEKYKEAEILVHETSVVIPDSVFIFNYSNSYSPDSKTILKLVRIEGNWLVDLKYTFSGNL